MKSKYKYSFCNTEIYAKSFKGIENFYNEFVDTIFNIINSEGGNAHLFKNKEIAVNGDIVELRYAQKEKREQNKTVDFIFLLDNSELVFVEAKFNLNFKTEKNYLKADLRGKLNYSKDFFSLDDLKIKNHNKLYVLINNDNRFEQLKRQIMNILIHDPQFEIITTSMLFDKFFK